MVICSRVLIRGLMHNALTICMQRELQWFSAGGWEHVRALRELEDLRESLALSSLEAQSRALGQCQTLLSCLVQFFWSSQYFWLDKISSFALLLVQGGPADTGGLISAWVTTGSFLPNCARHLPKLSDMKLLACKFCIFFGRVLFWCKKGLICLMLLLTVSQS